MSGRFELFADATDKFRWRLKAGNGEVIAQSQAYASKDAARKGIASVQTNAAGAAVADLTDSM
ncbi:YegP family protein [Nocardia sp. NPDC004151]|uniref:YegP family protein n=1 Tax=Nocardia sp. NPDC004151 TaxID=3364304 RepID=UPI0036810D2E